MKILGIIPARYGSSRFPGKPLAKIGGKTMIERVFLGCSECTKLSEIIIATDDIRIANETEAFGGKVMMTRQDHLTGTSRCAEVARQFDRMDWIINIQGDEPLIHAQILDDLIQVIHSHEGAQLATLIRKIEDPNLTANPNLVKAVITKQNTALYFSRSMIPYPRNPVVDQDYYQHVGIYAYRSDILQEINDLPVSNLESTESLEQLRWLENGYTIHVGITQFESHAVDIPEDIGVIEKYLNSYK